MGRSPELRAFNTLTRRRVVAEQRPIVLGRDTESPVKGRADRGGSAESCQAADVLDRFGRDLQQLAGAVDARIGEPCHGRALRSLRETCG